jgi:hypothetical protein
MKTALPAERSAASEGTEFPVTLNRIKTGSDYLAGSTTAVVDPRCCPDEHQMRTKTAATTTTLAVLLLLALPAAAHAQFTYTTNNGAVTITGYTGPGGEVVIPDFTNGYPVTGIGTNAFYGRGLTKVTIGTNVTSIGDMAFGECSLTNLTIGNSVASIGNGAFLWNNSLRSVTIPDSVTNIGNSAFYICGSLTNVTLGNGVLSIGSRAFGCISWLGCSIKFPNSLVSIGDEVFYHTGLCGYSVTIPDSVTHIGSSPFADACCPPAILVGAGNRFYSSVDGVLFNKSQTTLVQYPFGKILDTYTIPSSVTNIAKGAFIAAFVTNLVIGNSVISIGDEAIHGVSRSVTIGNGVTSIGSNAFVHCAPLAITVDPSNPAYSSLDGVLFNKSRTTLLSYPGGKAGGYTIPDSVTNIEPAAFYYRLALTSIIMGDSVTRIGSNAFYHCTSLTNVTMGDGVTSIGDQAFQSCNNLTSVRIGDGVRSIGNSAFYSCANLTSVTIGDSVTSIGDEAFYQCTKLTSVTIPDSVTSIGDDAFSQCTSLTSVTIPDSVTSIGGYTFRNCTSLTNVIIGSGVTSIGDRAFLNCPSLAGVYFRGNAPTVGGAPFSGATATVYYLPGTTGWGATYCGLPTAQWYLPNPQVLNRGASFGVKTNQFGFLISWATNILVVVEASTNPADPAAWFPVSTNTLDGGTSYYSDPQWTNYPARLYRLHAP